MAEFQTHALSEWPPDTLDRLVFLVLVEFLQGPVLLRVRMGDLRAHQNYLGRIVDPDQHDYDRGRYPIGRFHHQR